MPPLVSLGPIKNLFMTHRFAHIFIIEDNPGDIELLEIAFEMNGFQPRVQIAENGEIAMRQLEILRDNDDIPDLVLLDLNMPRMTGTEVLEAMRLLNICNLNIVVWTSSLSDGDRVRCLELGAREFLSKPERIGDYIRLVDELKKYVNV